MSGLEPEMRERIVALEVKVQHLTRTVESMDAKLTELMAVFQQAKGARWMLLAIAGASGFLAAKIVPIFSYLLPK